MTRTARPPDRDAEALHIAEDLETIERLIARDLKKPLYSLSESCQSLLEQHGDFFDRRARSLVEDSLDAISDMQSLIEGLRVRARAWLSSSRCRRPDAAGQPSPADSSSGD